MEIEELVIESVLRAMLYCMEADMGMEAARATDQYQKMDKRLSDLEAKHVAEMTLVLGLR